jgi:8-oxo-dGTP pyrophosphatase MutT (NUDIX family)
MTEVTTVLKHATASVFLFATAAEGGWRLGLIQHPRRHRWMLPGGHVEAYENPAEAALREVREETGLAAELICPPSLGDPPDASDVLVVAPAWIVEQRVPAEPRQPGPHVHVDHLYLAVADPTQSSTPAAELPFAWVAGDALDTLDMFDDTRARARLLFGRIAHLATYHATSQPTPAP